VGSVRLLARVVDDVPAKELRSMADAMKKQLGSGVVVMVSTAEGKASLVVGVTDDLAARVDARELARVGAEQLGGKGGGGRADMAQAGGPDVGKARAAVDAIREAIAQRLEQDGFGLNRSKT
jgi:alanyl-tRNA synthetase